MFGRKTKRRIEELEALVEGLQTQLDEERRNRVTTNNLLHDRLERLEKVYQPLDAAGITIARYRNALRDEILKQYDDSGEPPPIWLREIRDLTQRISEIEEIVDEITDGAVEA